MQLAFEPLNEFLAVGCSSALVWFSTSKPGLACACGERARTAKKGFMLINNTKCPHLPPTEIDGRNWLLFYLSHGSWLFLILDSELLARSPIDRKHVNATESKQRARRCLFPPNKSHTESWSLVIMVDYRVRRRLWRWLPPPAL